MHLKDNTNVARKISQTIVDSRTPEEVEQIVILERLHLYNKSLPCGAVALHRHLQQNEYLTPVPPVSRISRIIKCHGLTHRRTGWYNSDKQDAIPQ